MIKETILQYVNKRFSGKRLAILIIFVLLVTNVVCGLIYWRLNEVIKSQDEQIKSLTNQINTISEKIHQLSSE